MALTHSPKIVTDGLVFYYDSANLKKSWKGPPTTNLYADGDFSSGSVHPVRNGGSVIPDPTDSSKNVFKFSPAANNQYHGRDIPVTVSTVYSLQMEVYVSSNFDGTNVMMYPEQGGAGAGVSYDLTKKGTWQTLKYNGHTASTSNIRMLVYALSAFTSGYILARNIQVEQNAFCTPFVNGSRSATQSIIDLIGNNTITANSLTYNTDNTFNFNGSTNYITANSPTMPANNFTIELVVFPTSFANSPIVICPQNAGIDQFIQFSTNGTFNFKLAASADTGERAYTSTEACLLNSFNHIVCVKNGSEVSLYRNGVLTATTTGDTTASAGWGSTSWVIGQRGNSTYYFSGDIPIVRAYNRGLSANEVKQNYNAQKERYLGYQTLTYVASSNVTLTNNNTESVTMFKNTNNGSWNGQAYSIESFGAPCTIEFSKQAAASDNGLSYAMIGWNTDPTTDANYTSLDYASYPYTANTYQVYHNGSNVLSSGSWDPNKRFYVVYDTDGYIRHYNGDKLLYSVNYGTGKIVYVDSSLYSVDATYGGFSNVKVCRRSWNGTTYV